MVRDKLEYKGAITNLWFSVATVASLLLPAGIYLAFAISTPPQYAYVVESAVDRVWPLLFALCASIFYFIATLQMMRSHGQLIRLNLVAASAHPLSFLVSMIAAGPRSALIIAVLVLLIILVAAIFLLLRQPSKVSTKSTSRRHLVIVGMALGVYLALAVSTAVEPIHVPRQLGSLLILTVFSGSLGVVLCLFALKPKWAAVAGVYALIAAFLFAPNNHRAPVTKSRNSPAELQDAFAEWLNSRQDVAAYRDRNKPYPVILVSSEGGGIYAAAHAYGTLSAIQASCPTFSQHVFATVGVSGGALGNLLFAGSVDPRQAQHQPCNASAVQPSGAPVLADHLSPVLARFLLLEVLDRFTPGQLLQEDRGQILSDSFLDVAPDPVHARTSLSDSFDPRAARPAVISVAVNVATGGRVVLSPIDPGGWGHTSRWWPSDSGKFESQRINEKQEISLIDAAGLSARFPWITPTGRLHAFRDEEYVLADGGYFENSGADTVFDLFLALRSTYRWNSHHEAAEAADDSSSEPQSTRAAALSVEEESCDRPRIELVANFHDPAKWSSCRTPVFIIHFALASSEPAVQQDSEGTAVLAPRQSFLTDPLRTLLATRRSRGEIALRHMDVELCGTKLPGSECYGSPGRSFGMFRNDVSPVAWNLPLGWFMAPRAFDQIVGETADRRWFDYRSLKEQHEGDTELLIYHLDPSLYDDGADPSIGILIGGP